MQINNYIVKHIMPAIVAGVLCLVNTGCKEQTSKMQETDPDQIIKCTEPRPQICTMDYNPVCGIRDTGIRCVTTPCSSSELKTYSNACSACSDPKVYGYTRGTCRNTKPMK